VRFVASTPQFLEFFPRIVNLVPIRSDRSEITNNTLQRGRIERFETLDIEYP